MLQNVVINYNDNDLTMESHAELRIISGANDACYRFYPTHNREDWSLSTGCYM